MDECTI